MKKELYRFQCAAKGVAALTVCAACLAACGSADKGMMALTESAYANDTAAYGGFAEYDMPAAVAEDSYEEAEYDSGAGAAQIEPPEAQNTERKLIKTVNLNVETENFDSLLPNLESQIGTLNGYIENISVNNNRGIYEPEEYYGTRYLRNANITARIPKENLDTFLNQVNEQSNIVSRNENVEDVTLRYVDLESHKKVLVTEQERLLELLERAETTEDIITIEGRLSEVRYQIESMESQLRTFDNKIDYSTVYLYISEVKRYSPSEENTFAERVRTGFLKSLDGVGNGFVNFIIWLVVNLPYLVVWAVVLAAAGLILRFIWKRRKKRKLARQAQQFRWDNSFQETPTAETQAEDGEKAKREGNKTVEDKKEE